MVDKLMEIVAGLNAALIEDHKRNGITYAITNKDGNEALIESEEWKLIEKKKYYYLNQGSGGMLMVDRNGEIYNIKGYGVADKNKKVKANLGNIKDADPKVLFEKRYNYLR